MATQTSRLPAEKEKKINNLLSRALEVDGADMGNIQLFHPLEGTLTIIAQKGFKPKFLNYFKTIEAFDPSACGRAIGIGSTVVISDVNLDIAFTPYRDMAKAAGFRAVKSVPLNDKDNKFVGVLSTHFKEPKWDWETKKITTVTREIADLLSPDKCPNAKANKMKAAALAREFLAKRMSFEDMAELYPRHTTCEVIDILYNLIQNQPKIGGIYGVGIIKYDAYNAGIVKLIELLETTNK